MMKINLIIALLIISKITVAQNPILHKSDPRFIYAADPAAHVFNGKVYVYCSRDVANTVSFGTMQDYAVLESPDMKLGLITVLC